MDNKVIIINRPRTVEPGVAEHPSLPHDVVPVSRDTEGPQLVVELLPHQKDAVSHGLDVLLPATNHFSSEQIRKH